MFSQRSPPSLALPYALTWAALAGPRMYVAIGADGAQEHVMYMYISKPVSDPALSCVHVLSALPSSAKNDPVHRSI